MVGGFPAGIRIAAVIGCYQQEIRGVELRQEGRQPAVKFFQGLGKAFDIFAVSVQHIEVDEVAEDQATFSLLKRGDQLIHAINVAAGGDVIAHAATVVDVVNLADAENRHTPLFENI